MIPKAVFERAASLQAPSTGTETLAPLLYYFLRGVRPERVLEIGSGYTTPFLARALYDNAAEVEQELSSLRKKTVQYLGRREAGDTTSIDQDKEWLWSRPALIDPDFHSRRHQPHLVAIDDLSSEKSAAFDVMDAITDLALDHYVTFYADDFRAVRDSVARRGPFDVAWFDCGDEPEYRAFVDLYWDLVRDSGGYVIFHRSLTNRARGSVIRELKALLNTGERSDFELVNILEPHKLTQNSYCIVRKTGAYRERYYEDDPERIERAALHLLRQQEPSTQEVGPGEHVPRRAP